MQVDMEVIEPIERQGNNVKVNFILRISRVGMPLKTESQFLTLKVHDNASDEQIREIARPKICELIDKMMRDEP